MVLVHVSMIKLFVSNGTSRIHTVCVLHYFLSFLTDFKNTYIKLVFNFIYLPTSFYLRLLNFDIKLTKYNVDFSVDYSGGYCCHLLLKSYYDIDDALV